MGFQLPNPPALNLIHEQISLIDGSKTTVFNGSINLTTDQNIFLTLLIVGTNNAAVLSGIRLSRAYLFLPDNALT